MTPETLCMSCMQNDTGDAVCPKCGAPFDLPPKNTLQLKPRTMLREQYLIGRALGHGGFGVTYLAWDIGLAQRLAVKEYLPSGVAGRASGETKVLAYSEATQQEYEYGLERFLEEARTLKRFSSAPGIVSVDTIFRDNGTAYLVMEFLDGWTLEEFLKRRGGKITFETALRIMLPVIDALTAVHAESVLHRDISPDNIYLTRDGKVKVIDFGAARNALSQKSRNLSIILKEGYAPEEQYRASGIQGPWTDVYATAATIYHCVTGVIPQPSLDRLADDKVKRPSEMGIQIDAALERALMIALSLKASDRFQSMEDFKAVLTGSSTVTAIMGSLPKGSSRVMDAAELPSTGGEYGRPILPPPPPPPAPVSVPAAPDRRWIVPGVLGAVALVAIVLAMVMHKPTPPSPNPTPAGPTGPAGPTPAPNPEPGPGPSSNPGPGPSSNPGPGPTPDPGPGNPKPTPDSKKAEPGSPDSSNPNPDPGRGPASAPTGDYDQLVSQAKIAYSAQQFGQVQSLLRQAIKLDPTKPRAYAGLAELDLYASNNPVSAAQNANTAIAKGGEAVFHLRHDHSGNTFAVNCTGKLYVSQNGIRFVPETGSHTFNARLSDIREAKKSRWMAFSINRQRPIDPNPFHIRLQNGQNYNFAPMSRSTDAERTLILQLLGDR